ncbi:hypothetical protein LZZ85_10535 [Terrimonas sp. NA20]|uniref:Uncharacterized protein n=1 Tax=Terrimonas ginsenosidimutans TaxID=2908004 RepID=A0ABS9KQX2_9BACT|nr:hypothetical protein [Terrimonas ginsenosidimutans]MCG2614721.1 hypothetical protein [Terrimonas ginsenosidimutans]
MKALIIILRVFVGIALSAVLFLWFAAHASGHKIPNATDRSFTKTTVLLLFLLLILLFIKRRK